MRNRMTMLVAVLAAIVPLFVGGCSSSIKNVGYATFDTTGGGVEFIKVGSIDWFGQNQMVFALREDDGGGNYSTTYYTQGGNGFLQQIGPAAASGIAFYAGMDALSPDQTNINNSNEGSSASADGGDAMAEGGEGGVARAVAEGGDSNSAAYSAANAEANSSSSSRVVNPPHPKPSPKVADLKPAPTPRGWPPKKITKVKKPD